MERLKWVWKKQDIFNKVIFISGVVLALYGITQKGGIYSILIMGLMVIICAVRAMNTAKNRSRAYGGLFFHMPDGEVYPVDFEKARQEYIHGQGNRYMNRPVTVTLPYGVVNPQGRMDSLFGLEVDFADFTDPEGILPRLKRDTMVTITGKLIPQGKQFFYLGEVEEVCLPKK